ncbi:MAG: HAD family hydrolase [Roseimicrobium sp.]
MTSFAFFDLDHTLLPFDTQALFANFVQRREPWRRAYVFAFAPVAALRASGVVRTVTVKRAFMSYLWGMKRDRLEQLAREFAQTEVLHWAYPELRAAMAEHRAAGRTLVLNTASPDFYAREIALALGFDHCIATQIDTPSAMPFWPRVRGVNNKRGAKLDAMRRNLPAVASATAQQLRDSWSYSDSKADLPLLEFVGHAVLVHPDAALAALGKERGWGLMLPARPYASKLGDLGCSVRQALGCWPVASASS